jgi:O-methyltransferase involved in polyketide biosynthesis
MAQRRSDLEAVKATVDLAVNSPRPILFLAETVFVYFTEAQVKSLVLRLCDHFPGGELVFDGWRPFEIWLANRTWGPFAWGSGAARSSAVIAPPARRVGLTGLNRG